MGSNTFRSNKSETRDSFKRKSESLKYKKLSDQKTSLLQIINRNFIKAK